MVTTSGTYDYSLQAIDVLDDAWQRCRVDLKKITNEHTISAVRSLSLLMIEWENRGIKQWKIERQSITTTVGLQSVTLPTRTIVIANTFYRRNRNGTMTDTPLTKIGREDYDAIPDKSIQGDIPDRYFLDRQRDAPVLYFYTTPAIAGDSFELDCFIQTQDVGALSNNLDAPRRWLEAITSGVAAKLSEKWAPELEDKLIVKAERQFIFARDEERDTASTQITPNYGRQATVRG